MAFGLVMGRLLSILTLFLLLGTVLPWLSSVLDHANHVICDINEDADTEDSSCGEHGIVDSALHAAAQGLVHSFRFVTPPASDSKLVGLLPADLLLRPPLS